MPPIPVWAIGVGFILIIISVTQVVGRFLPPRQGRKFHLKDLGEHAQALEEVQARLSELDQVKQQLSDLEERLDFTERMLAAQRDAQRLSPPKEQGNESPPR